MNYLRSSGCNQVCYSDLRILHKCAIRKNCETWWQRRGITKKKRWRGCFSTAFRSHTWLLKSIFNIYFIVMPLLHVTKWCQWQMCVQAWGSALHWKLLPETSLANIDSDVSALPCQRFLASYLDLENVAGKPEHLSCKGHAWKCISPCKWIGAEKWCCDVLVFCCSLPGVFASRIVLTGQTRHTEDCVNEKGKIDHAVTDWVQKASSFWQWHIHVGIIWERAVAVDDTVCCYLCTLL